MTPTTFAARIQRLLRRGNFDDALDVVLRQERLHELPDALGPHSLDSLRLTCMISDVLDYGGRYDEARDVIASRLKEAEDGLNAFLKEHLEGGLSPALSVERANYLKQFAWVLILHGMTIYRHADSSQIEYTKARDVFEKSRGVLVALKRVGFHYPGTLARTWYCIGLVYREMYEYSNARTAFVSAIECGCEAILSKAPRDQRGSRHALSKCYALGTGWVSYSEALIAESQCDLVAARLLLMGTKARFITAYIELVYALVLMSARSDDLQTINEVINILNSSYQDLGGHAALSQSGVGHGPYALRVANKLALAHLWTAILRSGEDRSNHFRLALDLVRRIRESHWTDRDTRTYCNTFIIESRLYRESKEYTKALECAELALKIGEPLGFSRIDCWIALGEARSCKGDYTGAIDAFERALEFGNANRKVFAACHLQLARSYLDCNEPYKARSQFEMWETSKRAIENAFVRNLASHVRERLNESLKDFTISTSEENLQSEIHVKSLRRWLATTALLRTHDDYKAAANRLSVSENTVRSWMKG
jgi:tetratricopeptide (TPR) repeat protein